MIFFLGAAVGAQQSESPSSVERAGMAFQSSPPQPGLTIPRSTSVTSPDVRRLGPLALVPPDREGEIVRVVVPIGELAARTTRALARAQRRRAERKAHKEVVRALQEFQAQQQAVR